MKNPMTRVGIEPATFQLVAHHLNHCGTAVPIAFKESVLNTRIEVMVVVSIRLRCNVICYRTFTIVCYFLEDLIYHT